MAAGRKSAARAPSPPAPRNQTPCRPAPSLPRRCCCPRLGEAGWCCCGGAEWSWLRRRDRSLSSLHPMHVLVARNEKLPFCRFLFVFVFLVSHPSATMSLESFFCSTQLRFCLLGDLNLHLSYKCVKAQDVYSEHGHKPILKVIQIERKLSLVLQ